jgi:hypothetical protein
MDSAGAKSVMSEDMKDLTRGEEDISHQVQGHKANLSNPSKYYYPPHTTASYSDLSQTPQQRPRRTAKRSSLSSAVTLLTTAMKSNLRARALRKTWTEIVSQSRDMNLIAEGMKRLR